MDYELKFTVDNLYNDLRKISIADLDKESVRSINGLVKHMLGNNYPGLLRWLNWYGCNFMVPEIVKALSNFHWKTNQVVEFGAGIYGWMGRNIADKLSAAYISVDKRPEFNPLLVLNLETSRDLKKLESLTSVKDRSTVIVASEFLHVVNHPEKIINRFKANRWVVLEFNIDDALFGRSYREQIKKYGCTPVSHDDILSMFYGHRITVFPIAPYNLYVCEGIR